MTSARMVRVGTTSALLVVEALVAILLATDNALGFTGVDLLAGTAARVLASLGVVVGLIAIPHALRSRDVLGASIASLLICFVAAGPSGALLLSAVVVTIIQMVLPLGFCAVAWRYWLRCRSTSARLGSLGMLVLATVWLVGAMAPVPLELFLIAQILTVTLLVGLLVGPGWRWLGAHFRSLWDSAGIR